MIAAWCIAASYKLHVTRRRCFISDDRNPCPQTITMVTVCLCPFYVAGPGSGDSGVLTIAGEERQADRHASRDIIAETGIAALIGDIHAEVRTPTGIRHPYIGIGLPSLGIDHLDGGMAIEASTKLGPIDREFGDWPGNLRRRIAGPPGQCSAGPRHARDQFAAAILHRRDCLLTGKSLRRPRIARSDRACRGPYHALKPGQHLVERGKPAFGIGQIDPSQGRSDLNGARLNRGIGLSRLDVAIGARL
ncbi:UNVERIFIED_ORG: hypothetical protein M2348_003814 [Sphingomonas sp. R1F5B]